MKQPETGLTETDATLSRRRLLQRLLSVGAAGWTVTILYPITKFLIPPPVSEVHVTSMKAGALEDVWEKPFKIMSFGRTPIILFKDKQGTYRALDATCTHLSCIVQYLEHDNLIWCACHNGKFGLTGKVLSGPPPTPLKEYLVNINDAGEIWVAEDNA